MATLTVRNLSDQARSALKVRAARNNRSMEAEVRDILERAARDDVPGFVAEWLERAVVLAGDDLPLPERTALRDVDLA
ncbi:MAG TPA: plasmid stabilization protein [Microlunatus sp.]